MPGVEVCPNSQPKRLNVIPIVENQKGIDVEVYAVVQPSRLSGRGSYLRQTSSSRPQSVVNELTSVQDCCATAIDASIIGILA